MINYFSMSSKKTDMKCYLCPLEGGQGGVQPRHLEQVATWCTGPLLLDLRQTAGRACSPAGSPAAADCCIDCCCFLDQCLQEGSQQAQCIRRLIIRQAANVTGAASKTTAYQLSCPQTYQRNSSLGFQRLATVTMDLQECHACISALQAGLEPWPCSSGYGNAASDRLVSILGGRHC